MLFAVSAALNTEHLIRFWLGGVGLARLTVELEVKVEGWDPDQANYTLLASNPDLQVSHQVHCAVGMTPELRCRSG